jgi:hypothetical protein
MSEHQIWDIEKVKAYIANQDEAVTFFCGGSRNFSKFIALLDGVFVLDVDLDTMKRRIDERVALLDPTDFGGKPEETGVSVHGGGGVSEQSAVEVCGIVEVAIGSDG